MTRYLNILWSFLLCITCSYAKNMQDIQDDQDKIVDLVKNIYIKDLPYPNVAIDFYSIGTGQYYIVTMQNYSEDYLGWRALSYNCIRVFKDISLKQKFCFKTDDTIREVINKMPFFTIESYKQNRIGHITNTYLTFKLINDKFYLYQYSKEEEDVGKDIEETDNKTYIYYRQPRDDPKKEKLILLDDVNDELLQKLSKNANEN